MAAQPRFSTPRTDRPTLGIYAQNIATALGMPLMDWQRHVLDVALEFDPKTGRLAYRQVVLTVPRQSGKTTLCLTLMLMRALGQRSNIKFAMQTYGAAQSKLMDDWLPLLHGTSFERLYRTRQTNGQHALKFTNGSLIGLTASTESAGHGAEKVNLAILDEAFKQRDTRFDIAMSPAMMQADNPQLWVVSTAGTFDQSPYLWDKVSKGRVIAEQGLTSHTAYFEWSAPDDADPHDPDVWRACMPALGFHNYTVEAVAAEAGKLEPADFRRAYLNQWTTAVHEPVIPLDAWKARQSDARLDGGPIALAFDVTPRSDMAAIAAVGAAEGLAKLEVIDHRPGTNWLADRLSALIERHNVSVVCFDASSPAAGVAATLNDARLRQLLKPMAARDFGEACQMIYDGALESRSLTHIGQPEVTEALAGAGKRSVGDLWRWSRTSTSVDISPLVAITLALWGYRTQKPAGEVGYFEIDISGGPSPEPEVIDSNPFYSLVRG